MLLDNGVDLHSYQPTAEDMVRIADCDLFIHVGGDRTRGWMNRYTYMLIPTGGSST